jgi:hypothetical protein
MEAWGLPHLTESPVAVLYSHVQMAISRFEACEIPLRTGLLRLLPINETTIAIEGLTLNKTRRFLLSATSNSWKLSEDTPAVSFHEKLGVGDIPLTHLTRTIRSAYRTGGIHKISQEVALAVGNELSPKPLLVRGEAVSHAKQEDPFVRAWATADSILQSPTETTRSERAVMNETGKVVSHLLITFQEPKQRFILEMIPFPRPFDSRPSESVTITKSTISHFNPDGPEPFSSQERAFEVFAKWATIAQQRAT